MGTQLLSKGFHFSKLNCIVVVDGDFSSHGYDLRSAEKNVQLYHQLSGRAGREGNMSTIFFQTYTPNDEVLLNISKNDPHAFLKKELLLRKEKKLPPFYRLISIIISGKNELLIMKFATHIKSKLPKINNVNILGPVLAPIIRLKKNYRCRLLIRYPKNLFIQKYLSHSLNKIKIIPGIKLEVDVDPIYFSYTEVLSVIKRQKDTIEHIEFINIISYKTSLLGAKIEFKINIFKYYIYKLCSSSL